MPVSDRALDHLWPASLMLVTLPGAAGTEADEPRALQALLVAEGYAPGGMALNARVVPRLWTQGYSVLAAEAKALGAPHVVILAADPALRQLASVGFACNETDPFHADQAGYHWPGRYLRPQGPARLASPVVGLETLTGGVAGVGGVVTHADDPVVNGLYYRALQDGLTATVWLLPMAVEAARRTGRPCISGLNRAEIASALIAGLEGLSRRLRPPAISRVA